MHSAVIDLIRAGGGVGKAKAYFERICAERKFTVFRTYRIFGLCDRIIYNGDARAANLSFDLSARNGKRIAGNLVCVCAVFHFIGFYVYRGGVTAYVYQNNAACTALVIGNTAAGGQIFGFSAKIVVELVNSGDLFAFPLGRFDVSKRAAAISS